MTQRTSFRLSLAFADLSFFEHIRSFSGFPAGVPKTLEIEYEERSIEEDWLQQMARATEGVASWGAFSGKLVSVEPTRVFKIANPDFTVHSAKGFASEVAPLSIVLMGSSSLYPEWSSDADYSPPGFAELHYGHGFACAFKGEGHDRLVSRRWLDYGPWRLIRDKEQDFSFVQFHDLNADAETALEQAKPGHERMGISHQGGFLQGRYVYNTDFDGVYLPDEEILEIVVHGRKIPDVEMRDACALRYYQDLGDDKPLKNVRYVFVGGEQQAREYLHELWLRELECWAIVDGQKVRLDEDYEAPEPEKPDWVAKIEDEESGRV